MAENNMKTTRKRCVDAIQSLRFHWKRIRVDEPLNTSNHGNIYSWDSVYIFLESSNTLLIIEIKIILKWILKLRRGATKYLTRDQVQIFSVMKCTEAYEATLTTHRAHPFIIAWMSFYLCSLNQKIVAELASSQYPKEDPYLEPKSWKIPMKFDENTTGRNFTRDFVSII